MRTMLPQGLLRKSAVIGSELGRLSIDIATLSEVSLADSGTIREPDYTSLEWQTRGRVSDKRRHYRASQ